MTDPKSSVDPRAEITAILARLDALSGITREGYPAGFEFPRDEFNKKQPYRDLEPGSVTATSGSRTIAGGEQAQPHIWSFQVHHVAPTRQQASELAIETDMSLIGWAPSPHASVISMFFFNMYDETDKNGEFLQWKATRFYECMLGAVPDFTLQ